jgi:hypothetical protein
MGKGEGEFVRVRRENAGRLARLKLRDMPHPALSKRGIIYNHKFFVWRGGFLRRFGSPYARSPNLRAVSPTQVVWNKGKSIASPFEKGRQERDFVKGDRGEAWVASGPRKGKKRC